MDINLLDVEHLDAEAAEVLHDLLADELDAPPPQPDLDRATRDLLTGLHSAAYADVSAACGWDTDPPDDDEDDLWLQALCSTIDPLEDPGGDSQLEAATAALSHADWLTVVTVLARRGPGTDAAPDALVEQLRREGDLQPADEPVVRLAFEVLVPRWQELGVVDDDRRLTPLGAWGLPQALHELWCQAPADLPLSALGAQALQRAWAHGHDDWTPEMYADAARMLADITEAPLSVDLDDDPGWQPFLERVHAETGRVAPAYLLAVRAEWEYDVEAQSRWLAAAREADPTHRETLLDSATEAGDRGDAATARDLLRRAGVEAGDDELATYVRFAQPPPGAPSRNAPCDCGSGRKRKLCCGVRIGHPLPARAGWLYDKVSRFTQQPRQRRELLEWARSVGVPDAREIDVIRTAMDDPAVRDLAFHDGGLLARFLQVRGPLLPPDEIELARQWVETRRAAYEVAGVRPGIGLELRELPEGAVVEVRERTASRSLRRGDLLLARVLPTGAEPMLGLVMTVPRAQRESLLQVVSGGSGALCRWLAAGAEPPRMANTEGHELVLVEQRWRLSEGGWDRLAERLEADGDDVLTQMYDDDSGRRWLRARLERSGDVARVAVNSVERAAAVAELVREVDPAAELLEETRPDPDALRAVPDPVELTPDLQEAIAAFLREQEERWVDESIPMFGGKTPRQMVRSAAGRRQVEDFLADMAATAPVPGLQAGGMDAARIRELLGLPPQLF